MARADLVCELIKYGLMNDSVNFKKAVEAVLAEEKSKRHTLLATKIEKLLTYAPLNMEKQQQWNSTGHVVRSGMSDSNLFWEKIPEKKLDDLILPYSVKSICQGMVEEQLKAEVLQSHGLEPRNKMLLIGPPGNGKTSLAEAVAESLTVPLFTVRYESIISSYLGETASKLSKLFELAKTRKCVLFFDEFETLGKERGDAHEAGEIKRAVSSLLMQIDSLPSYVVAIATTNHDTLLDKAAWRWFQIKVEMPKPAKDNLELFFKRFQESRGFDFGILPGMLAEKTLGLSYAEAEELALEIYRQYVLNGSQKDSKKITDQVLKLWQTQKMVNNGHEEI